jgi:hypothetical protein
LRHLNRCLYPSNVCVGRHDRFPFFVAQSVGKKCVELFPVLNVDPQQLCFRAVEMHAERGVHRGADHEQLERRMLGDKSRLSTVELSTDLTSPELTSAHLA